MATLDFIGAHPKFASPGILVIFRPEYNLCGCRVAFNFKDNEIIQHTGKLSQSLGNRDQAATQGCG